MFRNIGNYFDKKKIILDRDQNKKQNIKDSLRIFLEKEFGQTIKGFSLIIDYDPQDNILTVKTDNKTLANEIAMRLADLHSFLQKEGIKLNRILVR